MVVGQKAILLFIFLMLISGFVSAMERFDVITTEEMKQMLDLRKSGQNDFILVNTLDDIIYRHASIPGSINIPWGRAEEFLFRLGEDKNRLIITYCMGYR